MDIKKILALAILVLALFGCMSVASAGWFDWFGGSTELANETYTLDGFSVDLPENATIYNESDMDDGTYSNCYFISWGNSKDGNNGSVEIMYMTGETVIESTDQFVQLAVYEGAISQGYYKDWAIINVNGVPVISGKGTYSGYILAKYQNGSMYFLMGDDLTQLENIADTFKVL